MLSFSGVICQCDRLLKKPAVILCHQHVMYVLLSVVIQTSWLPNPIKVIVIIIIIITDVQFVVVQQHNQKLPRVQVQM